MIQKTPSYYWFNYETSIWSDGENQLKRFYSILNDSKNISEYPIELWRTSRTSFKSPAYFLIKKNGTNQIIALGEIQGETNDQTDIINPIIENREKSIKLKFMWISNQYAETNNTDDNSICFDHQFNSNLQGSGLQLDPKRLLDLFTFFTVHQDPYVKDFIKLPL
jgi:hypothetical protein